MKKFFLIWFFGVMALGVRAQVPYDTVTVVDPQNFTLALTIDTALVQVISRKANANRRINFQTIKNYSTPDITLSWLGVDLEDTTGTSAAYRDFFVTDNEGEVWFVDNAGSARKLYDPAQFQAVTISNDTLYISDGNFAIIPGVASAQIDSVSFYGDTLRIYEGGSATPFKVEIISGGGVTGTGDADRITYWDTDTTLAFTAITYSATEVNAVALTGALGLPSGTTLQRPAGVAGKMRFDSDLGDLQFYNGSAWRSLPESSANAFTAGQFIIANPAGILTDTTAAGALSMMGGTSGSGASPQVAYWSGASTLTGHANLLWDGVGLSVGTTLSAYTLDVGTGGVYIAPQSAAVTGVEGAGYWDSDAPKGMWWHDGTAFRATVWGSAPSWTATYIPYSDGAKLVTEAAFSYNSGTDQLTVGEDIYAETFRTEGGAANEGLWLGSSATISILATGTGGVTNKFNLNVHSAGNEGYCTVQESGGTDIARLGNVPFTTGNTRGVFAANFGGMTNGESVTYTAGMYTGGTAGGSITVVPGSAAEAAHAGALYLRGGQQLATTTTAGNTGNIFIQTYEDNDSTAATTLRTHMVFSSDLGSWPTTQLLQRRATTTGIQELTMESDTIKYRISNIGAISTSTDGSGDVTVTHGMGTTPTAVLVTPTGTTAWIVSVHTIGATTFKVRFYDAAGAAVTSTAVTATWLGKT